MLEEDTDEIEYFLLRLNAPATSWQVVSELAHRNLIAPDIHRLKVFLEHPAANAFHMHYVQYGDVARVVCLREEPVENEPDMMDVDDEWGPDCWFLAVLDSRRVR